MNNISTINYKKENIKESEYFRKHIHKYYFFFGLWKINREFVVIG